jgi:hypothetical protein
MFQQSSKSSRLTKYVDRKEPTMKTIIAGSRDYNDINLVLQAISQIDWRITEVVCGEGRGVDQLGKQWADDNGIPVTSFPPNWKLGRGAGPVRNQQMADYADALIAIPSPTSKGTQDMIKRASAEGLRIFILKT